MRRTALIALLMIVGIQGIALAGFLDRDVQDLAAIPLAFAIQDKPSLDVNVDVKDEGSDATLGINPVWLAIGGLAVVVLVVLIAMAMRGGSSTVVKAD